MRSRCYYVSEVHFYQDKSMRLISHRCLCLSVHDTSSLHRPPLLNSWVTEENFLLPLRDRSSLPCLSLHLSVSLSICLSLCVSACLSSWRRAHSWNRKWSLLSWIQLMLGHYSIKTGRTSAVSFYIYIYIYGINTSYNSQNVKCTNVWVTEVIRAF